MSSSRVLLSCVVLGMFSSANLNAKVITSIEVKGNHRIDVETVKAQLPIKDGDDIDDNDANEAIGKLYESELFDDVKIKFSGSKLIVIVKEAPIINKISFEGNKKVKDEELTKGCPIKVKETLSLSKLKTFQTGMLQEYQRAGIYNAKVNTKIIKLPDNKVNLVFEIEENNPVKISRIVFYGNKKVSSSELRQVISSQPKHWYRFFAQDDVYRSERIEQDKKAIIQYYKEHGFAQARVISVNAEVEQSGRSFVISFHIDEGEQFKFGDISVKSSVKRIDAKSLNKNPKCKKDKRFNSLFVNIDNARILQEISRQGFSAVTVEPHFDADVDTKKISVRYDIKEGERQYISKIVIKGNTRTRDHVILKKLLFEEGDAYNKTLIVLSEGKLQSSGFFETVNIETMPDPLAPDKTIVIVNVSESKTGSLTFKAGYNAADGPFITFGYGERNFLGTGRGVNLSISSSREETGNGYKLVDGKLEKIDRKKKFAFLNSLTASVSDPHMFGKDIEGTVSFYKYTSSPFDTFSIRNIGASLGFSYSLTSGWNQSWELGSTRRLIDQVSLLTSPDIKYQTMVIEDGKFRPDKNLKYYQNALTHTLSYGTRVYEGLLRGNYSASLATTFFYNTNSKQVDLKNILSANYIRDLGRSMALKVQASVGMLSALGDKDLNIADGFSNSLTSVRGFSEHTLSGWSMTARRRKNSDKSAKSDERYINDIQLYATSTKKFFNGTVELSFPLNFGSDFPIRGFVFCDMGYYWDPISQKDGTVFSTTEYSLSDFDKLLMLQEATDKLTKTKETLSFEKAKIKPSGKVDEEVKGKYGDTEQTLPKLICPYETGDSVFRNNPLVGYKTFAESKLFISLGFGFNVTTPFGPVTIAFGFPVKKGKFYGKNTFLISGGYQL